MTKFELSQAADSDLNEIYIYSYREFGEATADAYLLSLNQCFQNLAEFPGLGRSIGHIRSGYFRFPRGRFRMEFVLSAFCTGGWTPNAISGTDTEPVGAGAGFVRGKPAFTLAWAASCL